MMSSGQHHIRIADLVPTEYEDFLRYCSNTGKIFSDELTTVDYVAYRSQCGRDKSEVKQLRAMIEAGVVIDNSSDAGDELEQESTKDTGLSVSDEQCSVVGKGTSTSADHASEGMYGYQEEHEPVEETVQVPISDIGMPALDDHRIDEFQAFQDETEHKVDHSIAPASIAIDVQEENSDNDSDFTYAELLGIDADAYTDFSIEPDLFKEFSISLSIRPLNALRNAKCKSIKDLLLLTPNKLFKIKNLGAKSVKEIEFALFSLSKQETLQVKKASSKVAFSARTSALRPVVESMLCGESYSEDDLNESEREILATAVEAADLLGNDFCIEIMFGQNHRYIRVISEMLDEFSGRAEIGHQITRSASAVVAGWGVERLTNKLFPYVQLYCATRKNGASDEFIALLSRDIPVSDYPKILLSEINLDSKGLSNLAKELEAFQTWMNGIDIDNICEMIFSQGEQKYDRVFDVLDARAEGHTLEEIAQQYGLTRERVRQIENKGLRIIKRRIADSKYNIIALISVFRNGDYVLLKEKIAEVIGVKYANLLWYCATRTKDKGCSYLLDDSISRYDSLHDAIIVLGGDLHEEDGGGIDNAKGEQIIAGLPSLIKTSELQVKIEILAAEQGCSLELLHIAVDRQYKKAGKYSYKGRLTVVQMCDFVLKNRFQNGYKIADATDGSQFQKHLTDLFGEKGNMTTRAVDAKVMEIGILIDRGKYLHKDYISIDKRIVDDIFTYIESSPKTAIAYSEIYAFFDKTLAGTAVTNRYALQGIMKLYNSPYASHRDYISKDRNGNVADELNMFVKARGIVHKSEILEEFPGWKDYNLVFVLPRCAEIIGIDNGFFIHASKLIICEDDYSSIKKYLDKTILDIPVSARYLQDAFMDQFPSFMIENDIQSYGALFGILQYMFAGKYHFSRPYIAKDNIGGITNKSVLLKHLEGVDSIEIADFVDLCQQNAVHYVSVSYLLDMMQPEFIRVDAQKLMRFDSIGFNEEMWQDIEDLISETVSAHQGYMAACNISDFSWYPAINIPWTPFLLESIASMLPNGINVVKMISSSAELPRSIFVSEEYADDDWISLLVKILKAEHAVEPFVSKTDILEWLQAEGLCNIKYPAALDTENHVVVDEDGKLRIQ